MPKNYRQCNPLMKKMHDAIWSAYDKGYEQAKTDFKRQDGKWTKEALGVKGIWYRCSNCEKYAIADYLFCPQCGSDMRPKEEES